MAEEIEFRLPSAIPYAYVGVKGTAEELAQVNFEMVAALYANALSAFQGAEIEAAKLIVQGGSAKPSEPTLKDVKDAGLLKVEPYGDTDPVAEDPAEEIKEQLGATEIESAGAPWERPAKAASPKPWETEKPKTKPVVDVEGW